MEGEKRNRCKSGAVAQLYCQDETILAEPGRLPAIQFHHNLAERRWETGCPTWICVFHSLLFSTGSFYWQIA
jgi:hypothetical protein